MAASFIVGHLGKINNFLVVVVCAIFALFVQGVSEGVTDGISVMEGDSVTLHNDVKIEYRINWYFRKSRIAQIVVNSNKTCTDVQCSEANEEFRDRLKLDYQTGSLTIINISHTDAGDYQLKTSSSDSPQEKVFKVKGVSASEVKRKFVNEGESVTLDTLIKMKTTDSIKWYFNDSVVAGISGNGEESSRDRLKLDKKTGSLIIMNISSTDSGNYHLEISSSKFTVLRTFSVNVTGMSEDDADGLSVTEGNSVTLTTGVKIDQQYRINWYFRKSRIAQIIVNSNKTCTDVRCSEDNEKFRDRLKLDYETGSLTITNFSGRDAGDYQLKIFSNDIPQEKVFKVKAVTGLTSPSATKTSSLFLCFFVLLPIAAAVVLGLGFYHYRIYKNDGKTQKPDEWQAPELKTKLLISFIGENQQQQVLNGQ